MCRDGCAEHGNHLGVTLGSRRERVKKVPAMLIGECGLEYIAGRLQDGRLAQRCLARQRDVAAPHQPRQAAILLNVEITHACTSAAPTAGMAVATILICSPRKRCQSEELGIGRGGRRPAWSHRDCTM